MPMAVDLDHHPSINMSAKNKDLLSTAMKRTSEWISSQEIPSDVAVYAAGVSFSLHKFPLVSKSGYIRKMISDSSESDLTQLDLTNVPGGAEAFELAAKFCYCINFEIGTENIAMLQCVAEYLEMTEEYSVGNLVGRSEAYLKDVVFKSLASALSVLHWNLGKQRKKIEAKQEHEKRVVLDTIVSLLPRDKNATSVSFLSMLLRVAIHLETTITCRLDLERRMGLQLGQAVLDDLMIPSFSIVRDTIFDVDTVQRIVSHFLEFEMCETRWGGFDDFWSPRPNNDMEKVVRVMENYLAEIASDRNLKVHKFIAIAELIPPQARINEDGMYRAMHRYLLEGKIICLI